jgi:hypothetical protein
LVWLIALAVPAQVDGDNMMPGASKVLVLERQIGVIAAPTMDEQNRLSCTSCRLVAKSNPITQKRFHEPSTGAGPPILGERYRRAPVIGCVPQTVICSRLADMAFLNAR